MLEKIIQEATTKMKQALEVVEEDLKTIRTGRATPALVEDVMVLYYGSTVPLKQVASITTPESSSILIQPWDKNVLGDIESAIRNGNLGFNPVNDGHGVRITLPPLTEERRKEFVKMIHQKAEAGRIALRNIRKEAWEKVQNEEKDGNLTEDDRDTGKDRLNKLIDDYNQKIEGMAGSKEDAIMKI